MEEPGAACVLDEELGMLPLFTLHLLTTRSFQSEVSIPGTPATCHDAKGEFGRGDRMARTRGTKEPVGSFRLQSPILLFGGEKSGCFAKLLAVW